LESYELEITAKNSLQLRFFADLAILDDKILAKQTVNYNLLLWGFLKKY